MTSPQDPFSTPPPERQAGGNGPGEGGSGGSGPGFGSQQPYGNQPYGSQPYGAPPFGTPGAVAPKNGLGVAALVLGVLALLTGWFFFGAFLGVLAIVLGFLGRRRAKRGQATNGGMALAGIVLGVLGILSAVVVALTVASLFGEQFSSLNECLAQAETQTEVQQCEQDFQQELTN